MVDWSKKIEITRDKTHVPYLRRVYLYADKNSPDISTATAALIYNPRKDEILSIASNHFPPGCELSPLEQQDRTKKMDAMVHAETGSIFKAARLGRAIEGATMYMFWVPCNPCALSIVDSGIELLIGHKQMIERSPPDWKPDFDKALQTLRKGGVKIMMYDGKIGGVKHRMRGEYWLP